MIQRILTALIVIPIILFLIFVCPFTWPFSVVVTITVLLGLVEFYSIMRKAGFRPYQNWGVTITALLCLISYNEINRSQESLRLHLIVMLLTVLILGVFFRRIFTRETSSSFSDISSTVLGVLYLGWLGNYLILIRQIPEKGAYYTFFLFLITWIYDAGAYFSGVFLGKHRFPFSISPRKTWEGFMGGLIVVFLAAMMIKYSLPALGFSYFHCGLLSFLLVLGGQAGDLAESAIKRSAGVKDSGTLVPGHGGILDRIDGLLFTAPIFYYYLQLVL